MARKPGGKLEPGASSEVAHMCNIADQVRGVFCGAAYFSIVHDQVDRETATGTSALIFKLQQQRHRSSSAPRV